ncbi:MAG TPA: glycosyltransferase family 2 protein [Mycobacteriales bacterium]|nr:glycosyltransferase family 2 protein [Mycobacteriales bacterium]
MRVSILVVTWNNAEEICACLDAALAQTDVQVEVVVVDNASSDDTRAGLMRYADRVRVIESPGNIGYAVANNVALKHATGEHVLLLNPDCVMTDDCVRRLVDHLVATPACGVAAASLRYPDGTPQAFARRETTLSSAWWCLTETGSRIDVKLLHGRHRDRRWYAGLLPSPEVVTVESAAAACVLLRRSDIGETLFDERFPLLYNDSDLYRRLRERGLRADVVPDASASHAYGSGLRRVPPERMRAESVRSLIRYAGRWWSPAARAGLLLALLVDCLACATMVVTRRRPEPALVALRGTWGGLGLPGGARPWLSRG